MKKRNALLYGLAGSAGLLLLFFGVLSIANSPMHAVTQFFSGWYWILALTLGFGTQVGLYVWMQNQFLGSTGVVGKEIAATGTVSGTSMAACCAHHLSDVLPLLGIGALSLFLNRFQLSFIVVGVFSNLLGIIYMLKTAQKHGVLSNHFVLRHAEGFDLGNLFLATVFVGIIALFVSFLQVFSFSA